MNLLLIEVIDIAILSVASVALILVALMFIIKPKGTLNISDVLKEQKKDNEQLVKELNRGFENSLAWFKQFTEYQEKLINSFGENVNKNIENITRLQNQQLGETNSKLKELILTNEKRLDKLTEIIGGNLEKMMQNNEQKLEQMRKTVDEKLDETLDKRFNQSFEIMHKQFETMTEQLNKMSTVANSVTDLQKVLTNVKTRGTFGEVQLGNLLEQMLAPNQFAEQVSTKEGDQRGGADFVIYLPGEDDKNTLLPIDAKFPVEDYLKLIEAGEQGDGDGVKKYREAIEKAIKKEAKSISQKYINPPLTTPFAILYVATEGMYSELLRNAGLIEELQREYKVIISGPTTFSAMLNSLQMGFKTLSVRKHASEIWSALTSFKKDFENFGTLLAQTQKKVGEVSNKIEQAATRTRVINKNLNKVANIAMPNEKTGLLTDIIKPEDEEE